MQFRKDIEGLRAVAIVPVVLYHSYRGLVPGGYVGVDVFFVISGFLISKIILDGSDAHTFSYGQFYQRRIRRIFPALFAMLAIISIAAVAVLPPAALKEFGETLAATALFGSNIAFYKLTTYFGGASVFKPLLNTWSLAVEEQFYIAFPIIVLGTCRWLSKKYFSVFLSLTAASLLLSSYLVIRSGPADFYLGPPRAFELLLGAILSLDILPPISRPVIREIVAGLGIAMIGLSTFAFGDLTPFPGLLALVPCVGTAAIIFAGQSGTSAVSKILSMRPVRFVGAISYSLYLWHWPMLALARAYYLGNLDPTGTTIVVIMAIAISIASWQFVELPFRSHVSGSKNLYLGALAATVSCLLVSAVLIFSDGLRSRYSEQTLRLFNSDQDISQKAIDCMRAPHGRRSYKDLCLFGDPDAGSLVAVWGDSHAAQLAASLGSVIGLGRAVIEISSSACPPSLNFNTAARPDCGDRNGEVLANLRNDRRVNIVVLIARYYGYSADWPQFWSGFEKTVSALTVSGKQVIIINPTPDYSYSVPDALGELAARGQSPRGFNVSLSKYQTENEAVLPELQKTAKKYHAVQINTAAIFCGQQFCRSYDKGHALYFDDYHLSLSGNRELADTILRKLVKF